MVTGIVDDKEVLTSSRVFVQNGQGQKRVTVSDHRFGILSPEVYHPGSWGNLAGETDIRLGCGISLLKLLEGSSYTNGQFFEIPTRVRRLGHSSDLRHGSRFEFDSFTTGRQNVLCLGSRFGRRSTPSPEGGDIYMIIEQRIFSTDAPAIASQPQIRDGTCGLPLVCVSQVQEGMVAGSFH